MFSNKTYDVLKWISLILLDAIGVFYKTISSIWGLPLGQEVLLTCSALSAFLGALIGISTTNYNAAKKEETAEDQEEG